MNRLRKLFYVDGVATLSAGIKIITLSRTIRWIGWGFGESLMPIFLLSFAHSFAETSLLKSVYDIVYIAVLPAVGLLADRFSTRAIMVSALVLYLIVGFSYLLAGATGLALFIVLARGTNGISYALDQVGIETYIRNNVNEKSSSLAYGFLESITSFGWMAAAMIGFFLVPGVSVQALLFLIVPTSLLALIPLWWLGSEKNSAPALRKMHSGIRDVAFLRPYRELVRQIVAWRHELRRVAVLSVLLTILSAMATFFLPIFAYDNGASLRDIIVMSVLFTVPYLFTWWFANLVKGVPRRPLLVGSFAAIGVLFAWTAAMPSMMVEITAAFLIELLAVLVWVVLQEYLTAECAGDHCGEISSTTEALNSIGGIVALFLVGATADHFGMPATLAAMAIFAALSGAYAWMYRVG